MIRKAWPRAAAASLLLWLGAGVCAAETPAVVYDGGLLSIRCANAPLSGILEQVKTATGMELIIEGTPAATRLTVDIAPQPVSLAIPRLLEGTGVNYLLVADGTDPRRVATMYVGSPGSGAAGAAAASPASARRTPAPPPRPAPIEEPAALPLPEPAPADEPAGEDDDVPTTPPVETETVVPADLGPDFHRIRDPFGRPIPRAGAGARQGNRRER